MTFDLCRKIIDEAVTHPEFTTAIFYGLADPFTDKGIFEKIRYAKKKGVKTTATSTNAGLLDEQKARDLLDCGLDLLNISLDGNTKETYEAIRRNLHFETTCENATRFLLMKRELGRAKPRVTLRTAYTETTRHEIESYIARWRGLADSLNIASVANWAGHSRHDNRRRLSGQLPCQRLWSCAEVTWDGRVPFCCFDVNDTIDLGDVNRDDLSKIWNMKKMQEIRQIHLESRFSELPLCAVCDECRVGENRSAQLVGRSDGKTIQISRHNPGDYKEIMDCLTTNFDYMALHPVGLFV
jgi:MoaA/NifB/PqqE/SkfB family radical SAM enzyme